MINPINSVANFTTYGYNINFRSKDQVPLGLDFQPKLRPQLVTDVFEKTTSGGIVSSKKPGEKITSIFPNDNILGFVDSKTRESERNKIIEQEKNRIAKTITKRTEDSKRKLRAAGVKEYDLYKYITKDGHINSEGQRILRGN